MINKNCVKYTFSLSGASWAADHTAYLYFYLPLVKSHLDHICFIHHSSMTIPQNQLINNGYTLKAKYSE